ncbi:hypothetical protein OSB04_012196 [Centaurea solstitialis]|uniref:Acyltransferase n=1 Tax=Centaurea solstitialis TaxID=347529 RepID=A0AA38WEE2_9ASTR|nr:hypothetical protein OSB04_012196 [Centaurea solstitialis]
MDILLLGGFVLWTPDAPPDYPTLLFSSTYQSFGACLALAVAARNPRIDLLLVLANSATSFNGSQLRPLIPWLEAMPKELDVGLHRIIKGMASTVASQEKQQIDTGLSEALLAFSSQLPLETLLWKLRLLDSASSYTNSRLHAVRAQTLILSSGHLLFMEPHHDLVTTLKATGFYRRTRNLDYVLDYLPPTSYEFRKARESHRFVEEAFSPVMLSTLENGKIVRGLSGIPSEGPVIFVGIMGAVPVSAANLFKLLKLKSHILLYPGGMREALHRKGEEYKLFWPEQSEFVRMGARFGAKIIPFGVVGEDDMGELIFDYEDQMKIPYLKRFIQELTEEAIQLRSDDDGEVGNQDIHLPVMLPKLPGRFYYLFGKPIETQGRNKELRDRDRAHDLYIEVKSEVENCLCYLKEKRKHDPYRNILSRLLYQLTHGPQTQIPTFEP